MRCTIKLTCIAHCLAASLHTLHQAGLLTDEYYAKYTNAGIVSHGSDCRKRYEPSVCSRFNYDLQNLTKPNHGDNPLEANEADISDLTASGYSEAWKEQLCKRYQIVLIIYVNSVYQQNSFEKRVGENIVKTVVSALIDFMVPFFSNSELLRRNYTHVESLMDAYDYNYREFCAIMSAISHVSARLESVVENPQAKELESLDDAAIGELDALRKELDHRYGAMQRESWECFRGYILTRVSRTDDAPQVLDDGLINRFTVYCEKALAYVWGVQERISAGVISRAIRLREMAPYLSKYGMDPYMSVHLVYPEMDYAGWGSFWLAAQKQLAHELEALQKHVDEVQICRSAHTFEPYLNYLVSSIDSVFENLRIAHRDRALSHEEIDKMIDDAITAVAEDASSLSFEDIDRLVASKTKADDQDMLGSYDMLDNEEAVGSDFELVSTSDTVADDAPGPSRKRTHNEMAAATDSTSAEGSSQHSRMGFAARSEQSPLEPEPVKRMRTVLKNYLAMESERSQSEAELFERMCEMLAKLKTKPNQTHRQGLPRAEE
ncbi:hypothetical protein PAPHI01_1965 [Pancytospora philotis]|nr:hypothetical protein PAPHI01_1965 [Pancytospora philotis]